MESVTNLRTPAPDAQAPAQRAVSDWQIRQLFFKRLPGAVYVGIQETYGTNQMGDLLLYQSKAKGTTLAFPLSIFQLDPEKACVLIKARLILESAGEKCTS